MKKKFIIHSSCKTYLLYWTGEITLKNVWKTYDLLVLSNTKAKKVLNPPLNTAGPIDESVLTALSETKQLA